MGVPHKKSLISGENVMSLYSTRAKKKEKKRQHNNNSFIPVGFITLNYQLIANSPSYVITKKKAKKIYCVGVCTVCAQCACACVCLTSQLEAAVHSSVLSSSSRSVTSSLCSLS